MSYVRLRTADILPRGSKIMCFSGLFSFCWGFLCPFIWPVSAGAAGAHSSVPQKKHPSGQMRYLVTRRRLSYKSNIPQ